MKNHRTRVGLKFERNELQKLRKKRKLRKISIELHLRVKNYRS